MSSRLTPVPAKRRRSPLDDRLLEYATDREREIYVAVRDHGGSASLAAAATGETESTINKAMQRLRRRAGLGGWAPEAGLDRPAIPGFTYRRISTLSRNEHGEPQWQIQEPQRQRLYDAMREAADALVADLRGKIRPTPPPRDRDADLLAVYPIGDAHVGLYSWAAETGDDTNLERAEADLVTAMSQLVSVAPPAEQGLLVSVGDMNHADTSRNLTPQSGHPLDVDTRYAKVMSATLRTTRRMVDLGLRKHKRMHVILARGNHDPHAAIMQALALSALYEKEPRVTVDLSPAAFYWYRHGKCFIGVNHGDKVKPEDIPLVMATDRPDDWAAAKVARHVYSGHWHHDVLRDYRGCTVETIRTLAAPDSYSAEYGYRSKRDMKCDVWHGERGRIRRYTIGIEEIRELQAAPKKRRRAA